MGISLTSSVLLLVAMVAGIRGASVQRRQMCEFVAMSCGNQFQSIVAQIEQENTTPDISHMCTLANQARRCMGPCINVIIDNPAIANSLNGILDYVCDPRNRDEVMAVAQAQCFRDGTIENQFEHESEECVEDHLSSQVDSAIETAFANGNYDVESILCPLVHDVMGCIDNKVVEMCGEDVVPFVNRIFNIVLGHMLSSQLPTCFDQVRGTHEVMKRAIEYVKMIRKK